MTEPGDLAIESITRYYKTVSVAEKKCRSYRIESPEAQVSEKLSNVMQSKNIINIDEFNEESQNVSN